MVWYGILIMSSSIFWFPLHHVSLHRGYVSKIYRPPATTIWPKLWQLKYCDLVMKHSLSTL